MNNYCRNCGQKLEENAKKCEICDTQVIDKRIKIDDGYIKYIVANIILILFSFLIIKTEFAFFSFQFLLIALILILIANENYKNNKVVFKFLSIELPLFIGYLIYIFIVLFGLYVV